jgi:hypothetical protein
MEIKMVAQKPWQLRDEIKKAAGSSSEFSAERIAALASETWWERRDLATALSLQAGAVETFPSSPYPYSEVAIWLVQEGKYAAAKKAFARLVELDKERKLIGSQMFSLITRPYNGGDHNEEHARRFVNAEKLGFICRNETFDLADKTDEEIIALGNRIINAVSRAHQRENSRSNSAPATAIA